MGILLIIYDLIPMLLGQEIYCVSFERQFLHLRLNGSRNSAKVEAELGRHQFMITPM